LLRTLSDHGAVTAVAIAADGKVATGSADKKVRVWPSMEKSRRSHCGYRARNGDRVVAR
jgi:hypothetical protein